MDILDISTYSQYLSFLLGIYAYFKKNMHKYLNFLLVAITIGTIAEIVNPILRNLGMKNILSMNIYTFLNCLVFIFLYKKTKTISEKWFWILNSVFIIGSCYSIYFQGVLNQLNTILIVFANFILMFLSAKSLIKMTNGDVEHLFLQPLFWLSANLLMFSTASNIVYSIFPNSLYYDNNLFYNQIWTVFSVLNIIYNLLFAYVFICHLRNPSYTQ